MHHADDLLLRVLPVILNALHKAGKTVSHSDDRASYPSHTITIWQQRTHCHYLMIVK
jgi:hypothetical protein